MSPRRAPRTRGDRVRHGDWRFGARARAAGPLASPDEARDRHHHPASRRAVPGDRAVPRGQAPGFEAAHPPLRGVRQPQGQAAGVPARRTGRRHRPGLPALLRPAEVADRAVRPARLRQEPPVRRAPREHHVGSGRRYRAAARAPRHRPLGGVRRQLGQHARAGLCRDPRRAGQGARAARHLHAPAQRAAVVLPGGREPPVPRGLGGLPRGDPAGRATGHDGRVLQAPDQPQQGGTARRGQGVVGVGGQHEQAVHRSGRW